MDGLVGLVANLGFPIAVAIYLLWRDGKKIDSLVVAVENNTKVLERVCDKLD